MQLYRSGEQFVFGVDGGEFYSMNREPEAIILNSRPIPTKKWSSPAIKDHNKHKNEEWEVTIEFTQFLCDSKLVYVFDIESIRYKPRVIKSIDEFFVTEDFVNEKIDSLRKIGKVLEYIYDASVPTWNEVKPKLYYRRVPEK